MSDKASVKPNLRKWIQITVFPLLDAMPTEGGIKLSEHQFLYRNMPKNKGLITGVYGAVSRNDALFIADEYATKHNKVRLSADIWYHIEDINLTRNQIDQKIMEKTGFAHLSGLSTAMRTEIHESWLKWISKDVMPAQMPTIRDMDFERLVATYPQYIEKLFEQHPDLLMLVHPVHSILDEDGSKPLINVATVRIKEERIMHFAVRYFENMKVSI